MTILRSTRISVRFWPSIAATRPFEIDSAAQGREALELVQRSGREGRPYALAFVDIRMPPGWGGIETIERLWGEDPDLQIVICSAYSDHSHPEIVARLGTSDRLFILKKPFETDEIKQMADALTRRWSLEREVSRIRSIQQRALFHDNPSMLTMVDTDGAIIEANYRTAQMLGYRVNELIGTSVSVLIAAQHQDAARQFFEACIREPDTPHHWQGCKVDKAGQPVWVRETAHLTKDIDGRDVILVSSEDITELQSLSAHLTRNANQDTVTGLLNRDAFLAHLNRLRQTKGEKPSEHTFCYLDVDAFKLINETCGHIAGDDLLRQFGTFLKQQVRTTDVVGRLGGDEFGIMMHDCPLDKGRRIVNALRKAIKDFRFIWKDERYLVTVSSGLVPLLGTENTTINVLVAAEAACHAASQQGRNGLHIFHNTDTQLAARKKEMHRATEISQAIHDDRLRLYYQPILPLVHHATRGAHYEILLRLEDEEGNIVTPGSFLPAAERYNLSVDIDRWVIRDREEDDSGVCGKRIGT